VLLFELFPVFVTIVALLVGIALFAADRRSRASRDEQEALQRQAAQRSAAQQARREAAPERGGRRPSMAP
jgi:hypothetical protein